MKAILSVYSIQRRMISWSIRIGVISVGIIGLTHYNENPVGLLIFFVICVGIAGIVQDEEVKVFQDHLSHNKLLFAGLLKRKKKYVFDGLQTCAVHNDDTSIQKLANELILERHRPERFNYLDLSYIDMKKVSMKTNINIVNLRKINEEVNKILLTKSYK